MNAKYLDIVKRGKFVLILAVSYAILSSCGVSACDCAVAAANDDDDVWSECRDKMDAMSYDEKADFQNRMVKCVNPY